MVDSFRVPSFRWVAFVLVPFAVAELQAQSVGSERPTITMKGGEDVAAALSDLRKLHEPGTGPKSTLWDAWLVTPSLWPATPGRDQKRDAWREVLLGRKMSSDGYVATHQHPSIAHPEGWPFPFWNQGQKGFGRHYSFAETVGPPWRQGHLDRPQPKMLTGAEDRGVADLGWRIAPTSPRASIRLDISEVAAIEAPFLQIRWSSKGAVFGRPHIAWRRADEDAATPAHTIAFDPPRGDGITTTVVACSKDADWRGTIAEIVLDFDNPTAVGEIVLHSIFSQYDTRQNVNGADYVIGAATFFDWIGDVDFLRQILPRLRKAIDHLRTEHRAAAENVIHTPWVGHDGRSGIVYEKSGEKRIRAGYGIGNNYWDLMPFGGKDAYATIRYESALRRLARLERTISRHADWKIPPGEGPFTADALERHADAVRSEGRKVFWNAATGRFVGAIDDDGLAHDYGFTFLNLEAVASGFADPEQSRSILAWIAGDRKVDGDTSIGEDIYFWRFGPRSTTRRNIDWYVWAWSGPESIPFGGQVQDGGAVLGFSAYDFAARLRIRGPDDAYARLSETARWFKEVSAAGGYRKYYDGKRPGTLQGGGTAGGLGMDHEFFESSLVPDVLLEGFLGFRPFGDGFEIAPQLPSAIDEIKIDGIRFRNETLSIRATKTEIEIRRDAVAELGAIVEFPADFSIDVGTTTSSADVSSVRRKTLLWTAHGSRSLVFRRGTGPR